MNAYAAGPFLSQIDFPADLRAKFKPEELQQVSDELRQFIVDVVSEKGGHFGASLVPTYIRTYTYWVKPRLALEAC